MIKEEAGQAVMTQQAGMSEDEVDGLLPAISIPVLR
jgi:hypothetical protein